MGEHKLPPNKSGFLRGFLRKPPGVPTKIREEDFPDLEVQPNYIRRAMRIRTRRVVIPSRARLMMHVSTTFVTGRIAGGAPRSAMTVLNEMHPHQTEYLDLLRRVNDPVSTFLMPEGVGKQSK